jgi:hypothetical protein
MAKLRIEIFLQPTVRSDEAISEEVALGQPVGLFEI